MVKKTLLGFNVTVAIWAVLYSNGVLESSDEFAKKMVLLPVFYFVQDFYSCKWDFKFHHVVTCPLLISLSNNFSGKFERSLAKLVGQMELSTVFLDFLVIFPENKMLQGLFVGSFFYTRVYKMFLFFSEHWEEKSREDLLGLTFLLFLLQLYWAKKIVAKFLFRKRKAL
jgi:hypothetical protein